jgi:hypothetical protein
MLDQVKLDYDRTSEFIRGVLATATTIRGWAITIWGALAALSVQQDQSILSALALVVAVGFYIADLNHFQLYRRALQHIRTLERLYADYYGALSRSEFDDEAFDEFLIDLEAHQSGFYRQLGTAEPTRPLGLKESLQAAPPFVAVYGVLIVASVALAVLEATTKLG